MNILSLPLAIPGPIQIILVLVVSLFLVLFPIIAIIDIVRNDFKGNDKLIWVLVTLLVPFLGPILYFIIGRKARIKN